MSETLTSRPAINLNISEKYLVSLPRFSELGADAYKPGLERIEYILAGLGDPHLDLSVIHVAGTNGKGSTSSLISSILTSQGYRTGLYTSPHITTVRERIRVDGEPISSSALDVLVEDIQPYFDSVRPSFFEGITALAFKYFADADIDVLVAEVGLGGRLDATNVVNPVVSVITSIGLDHISFLGDTLDEIAAEKGGIIKVGVPVVVGFRGGGLETLADLASKQNASLHIAPDETSVDNVSETETGTTFDLVTPDQTYKELQVTLPGHHQISNAVTAVRTLEVISDAFPVSPYSIRDGLLNVRTLSGLRGRLEMLQTDPPIIIDVAHNPDGVQAGLQLVAEKFPGHDLYVALGIMADKDVAGVIKAVADYDGTIIPIALPSERAASIDQIRGIARSYSVQVVDVESITDAVDMVSGLQGGSRLLLITGSHQTVEMALTAGLFD